MQEEDINNMFLAYHLTRSKVAVTAVLKRALSRGMKNTNTNTPVIHRRIFISFLNSISDYFLSLYRIPKHRQNL
jgi:hypothetical protein